MGPTLLPGFTDLDAGGEKKGREEGGQEYSESPGRQEKGLVCISTEEKDRGRPPRSLLIRPIATIGRGKKGRKAGQGKGNDSRKREIL